MSRGAQNLHDIELMEWVEPCDWLVGEQQRRFDGKCACKQDPSTLTTREHGGTAIRQTGRADRCHGMVDGSGVSRARRAHATRVWVSPESDDCSRWQRPLDVTFLRQVGERSGALACAQYGDLRIVEIDLAGRVWLAPDYCAQQRRFARAVRPDEAN
jgi:hypothetical protein